jgi:hypothetical protein
MSMPWFMVASPWKATATRPGCSRRLAIAAPTASGPPAPTMPSAEANTSGSITCMWPAWPLFRPWSLPTISKANAVGSVPRAISGAVLRWSRPINVVAGQVQDHTCVDSLLTNAGVILAGHQPVFPGADQRTVDQPHPHHRLVRGGWVESLW